MVQIYMYNKGVVYEKYDSLLDVYTCYFDYLVFHLTRAIKQPDPSETNSSHNFSETSDSNVSIHSRSCLAGFSLMYRSKCLALASQTFVTLCLARLSGQNLARVALRIFVWVAVTFSISSDYNNNNNSTNSNNNNNNK